MITIPVPLEKIEFAKKQISEFEKISAGRWRYKNVEAWRGIVCEILTSDWLKNFYNVIESAKGLDNSGIYDSYDILIDNIKIEVKSATKNYFRYIMPKVYDITHKPKDFYIGVKYNETTQPNEVIIVGFITRKDILKYKIERNKGAPYYKIPLSDLQNISLLSNYLNQFNAVTVE